MTYIRADTLFVERHVLLRDDESAHSLLSVSRREFVSELRSTRGSHENLDEEVVVLIAGQQNLVDVGVLGALVAHRLRTISRVRQIAGIGQRVGLIGRHLLVDQQIAREDALAHAANSVHVERRELAVARLQ